MGYCPSVCILKPGELIHINKGRLHAFRKLSSAKLPDWDCHAEQRKQLIEEEALDGKEQMCISIAWDWMNRGVTPAGISREVCSVLEATILNKRNGVTSLAIPEMSLFQMARRVPARPAEYEHNSSFLRKLPNNKLQHSLYAPSKELLCQGILPGLRFVVDQHLITMNVGAVDSNERFKRLSIAEIPDTQCNPAESALDPYGDSDFDCKICRVELSNVYYHCDGCEKLLSKDFNICHECYTEKRFAIYHQMHPTNPKKHATLNHTGNNKFDRQKKCPCKNGPACGFCSFCLGCSCRCHTWFTVNTRLFPLKEEEKLFDKVKNLAEGSTQTDDEKTILEERVGMAQNRLQYAKTKVLR